MQYIRKVFDKHIKYGDNLMGKPDPKIDYLAVKLFDVKKKIKDYEYNISYYIPKGNYSGDREEYEITPKSIETIELRYVEPYSHLKGLHEKDKKKFEEIENTEEFKEKLKNKELKIFCNRKNSIRDGFWLHVGQTRYYTKIKGKIKKEDGYSNTFKVARKGNLRTYSSKGYYNPYYSNEEFYYLSGEGNYEKANFSNYPLVVGSSVYLIIYKGHLPRHYEYRDVYKDFYENKEINGKRYLSVESNPQNERLREKDLKGTSWEHVNFKIQYTYLEENMFNEIRDIIE